MGTPDKPLPARVSSVDAYRGLVMFLMMAEVLRLGRMAANFPDSPVWQFLGHHQSHVEWAGCSLHDLIQPSFSFLVGVALPFSLASRLARGQGKALLTLHAVWRALVLVFLGVFLRSVGKPRTNFTFEDTLSQIGLGYVPLFLLGLVWPRRRWVVWLALVVILVGYWGTFALDPPPGPDFDYPAVGVPQKWHEQYDYTGFAAHWNKNSNPAWAFDTWFLNLFPRDKPFQFNGGGYATLSFIPTLGTMILGLIAGAWLKELGPRWRTVGWLVLAGAVCMALGLAADANGVCPSVKRIWTPAWTLYSGGWCFFLLAGFYAVMDVIGFQSWAFPLRVIGMNSIAAYCLAHLIEGFIVSSLKTHLGKDVFQTLAAAVGQAIHFYQPVEWPIALQTWGKTYEPLATGAMVLLVLWLILFWMYRRRIFLRI
jgi:predicted acyltransferase